jgi:hypothetical protein
MIGVGSKVRPTRFKVRVKSYRSKLNDRCGFKGEAYAFG